MPHATLKLLPGVDTNRTMTLNEAAISETNLVRFVPDKQGAGLVQKLGGWQKFVPYNVGSTVRALWAWEDSNSETHLALGAQNRVAVIHSISADGSSVTITHDGSYQFAVGETIVVAGVTPSGYNGTYPVASATTNTVTFASATTGAMTVAGTVSAGDALSVISSGSREIITPRTTDQSVAVSADTTAGSSTVQITATASYVDDYDSVYIKTHISVGGLILFGVYQASYVDGINQYLIAAHDALGNPQAATSTVTAGGAVAVFDFLTGEATATVTLADHGFLAGDTFPVLVPLTAAGVTVYGNCFIRDVVSSSQFVIQLDRTATSTTTVSINGGNAYYEYFNAPGPTPTGTGYGVGGYGVGGYGTGVAPTNLNVGNPISATDWSLDNWGDILLSCPVRGQIYEWRPGVGATRASLVPNAPVINDGMFIAMPQRQVVAWGSTFNGIQDPMLIRWSDVNDYNSWIDLPANQAGSYRIPKGSRIVGCIQGPQQGLVWTDLALWAMQYVGPSYVYQFSEIGNGCGLISRRAATSMNGVVYWMGQSQFYRLSGGGVEAIPCPVWDVIFQDLDTSNLDKIRIAANSRFAEIAWYYPTIGNGGEVSRYVKYNTTLNVWDFGELSRTAWINESVLGAPIGSGPSIPADEERFIYQHETSTDADGQAMHSYFRTGYFSISDGEYKTFVDQVWPDMKWGYYDGAQNADLGLTFYVTDYPTSADRLYGPYQITSSTNYLTPRFRARLVSIHLDSNTIGSFWRIGGMRYRYAPDGKF